MGFSQQTKDEILRGAQAVARQQGGEIPTNVDLIIARRERDKTFADWERAGKIKLHFLGSEAEKRAPGMVTVEVIHKRPRLDDLSPGNALGDMDIPIRTAPAVGDIVSDKGKVSIVTGFAENGSEFFCEAPHLYPSEELTARVFFALEFGGKRG